MSPPGDWPEMYLACTSAGRACRRLPTAAQVAHAGIPWAIISDGPALRKGRKLSQDMEKLGHSPDAAEPGDDQDFTQWRSFWERAGVFTLATQFGDDGTKRGEFEELVGADNSVTAADLVSCA
jgi:hypothetical protein